MNLKLPTYLPEEIIFCLPSTLQKLLDSHYRTGEELFSMFKVGQKFRADAVKNGDDDEFTVNALYVDLDVIDLTKLRFATDPNLDPNLDLDLDPNTNSSDASPASVTPDDRQSGAGCGHLGEISAGGCGVQRCPWCET